MAEVINLQHHRIKSKEKKTFKSWKRRFDEHFDYFTRLTDLSGRTLFLLANPGESSREALREMILAVLNIGNQAKYFFMERVEQSGIDGICDSFHFQVILEVMRRLGWKIGRAHV
mgnify:CR=1 FL=1